MVTFAWVNGPGAASAALVAKGGRVAEAAAAAADGEEARADGERMRPAERGTKTAADKPRVAPVSTRMARLRSRSTIRRASQLRPSPSSPVCSYGTEEAVCRL